MVDNWGGYSVNGQSTRRNVDEPWLSFHFIHKMQTFEILQPTSMKRKDTNIASAYKARWANFSFTNLSSYFSVLQTRSCLFALLFYLQWIILNEQACPRPSAVSFDLCLQVCPKRSDFLHWTFQWSLVFMAMLPMGREMSRWGQKQHLWLARIGWHCVHNFHFKEFRDSLGIVHCSLGLSTSPSYLWYNYSWWKIIYNFMTSEQ